MKKWLFLALLVSQAAAAQSTLDAVRSRGFVQCGVNTGLAGFAQPDSKGVWRGLDVDLCRAVAAAVFGDARRVRFTPLTSQQRFTALQSGEVDILARNTTWTLSRDTAAAMAGRGPKARVVELAGVGHAPTLMHADQIALVRDFLLQGDAP